MGVSHVTPFDQLEGTTRRASEAYKYTGISSLTLSFSSQQPEPWQWIVVPFLKQLQLNTLTAYGHTWLTIYGNTHAALPISTHGHDQLHGLLIYTFLHNSPGHMNVQHSASISVFPPKQSYPHMTCATSHLQFSSHVNMCSARDPYILNGYCRRKWTQRHEFKSWSYFT